MQELAQFFLLIYFHYGAQDLARSPSEVRQSSSLTIKKNARVNTYFTNMYNCGALTWLVCWMSLSLKWLVCWMPQSLTWLVCWMPLSLTCPVCWMPLSLTLLVCWMLLSLAWLVCWMPLSFIPWVAALQGGCLACCGCTLGSRRGCTDLYCARGAQGVLHIRVGGATSQLDLPSLTPLSAAGCGWLQLGVPHWAASVQYCK